MSDLLTIDEIAERFGVSRRTVYRLIADGEFPFASRGKVRAGDINRYLRRQEGGPLRPSVPLSSAAAVLYRFFDADGLLLYVGITGTGLNRWTQHAKTQPWWRAVASATLEHFDTGTEALEAEVVAIRDEHPVHNVRGQSR